MTEKAQADASDSQIKGPPYRQHIQELHSLTTEFEPWAMLEIYGYSVEGRPLAMLRIEKPAKTKSTKTPAIFISGATHGNEYLNIVDRLPRWILDNKDHEPGLTQYLAAGGSFYIVPILNPDGYENHTRKNSNGKDLNRDFYLKFANQVYFTQPETKYLAEKIAELTSLHNKKLKLTIDYHCCDGSLLFPWSYTDKSLPDSDYLDHEHIAQLMLQTIGNDYRYGSTGQVLGYFPKGTSKDYFYSTHGAMAFTFEGHRRSEQYNFDGHLLWLLEVIKELN
tara:strand:- start:199 stop:1035 length:837 start_codon:yes stop_codon:yes gene_type:complete